MELLPHPGHRKEDRGSHFLQVGGQLGDVVDVEHLVTGRRGSMDREQLLGDVAASWFADDNAYDAVMLNRFKQSLLNPSLLNSSQSKVEEPFMPQLITTSSEYEDQRRIILAAEGISAIEKSEAIASIRRDFFSERSDYLRQALRDLAVGD